MNFAYILDLPAPPFSAEEVATKDVLFRREVPEWWSPIPQLDGTMQNVTIYSRTRTTDYATKWVLETVPELEGHIREVGIQTHENSNKKNGLLSQFPVHTDGKRGRHVLCYLYDTGGANAETVWWQEEGQPIYRTPGIFNEVNPAAFNSMATPSLHKLDLSNLVELQRITFPKGKWNLLEADVLHSLHGVEIMRVGLTIGFSNNDVLKQLIEKYSIST